MEGMTYLTVAYLGMIAGIAIWTWTVVNRSKAIEARLEAVEASIGVAASDADAVAKEQAE
ncbi:hypothetical protein N9A87_01915 [Euryarchaeota archaeon]|jgi:hypothetical protein|nr:hypothetical protein [Euryarchaeota archaeon]DAC33020.1 MAG TPA: hypothetical protein D7H95_01595 [Candidatus Poseidoniales archaeon]HII10748.1 hypothetical protein [Candidatus Poseidoniaceae archaeon]|tara:strand:- start:1020 stop:1199 length:180 start_codon:yes stop_codon:yes gene_type:complete